MEYARWASIGLQHGFKVQAQYVCFAPVSVSEMLSFLIDKDVIMQIASSCFFPISQENHFRERLGDLNRKVLQGR